MDTVSILRYVSCKTKLRVRIPKRQRTDPYHQLRPVPYSPGITCNHSGRCISSNPVSYASGIRYGLGVAPCCFARMTGTYVLIRCLCTERTNPAWWDTRHHQLGISCGNHQPTIAPCFSPLLYPAAYRIGSQLPGKAHRWHHPLPPTASRTEGTSPIGSTTSQRFHACFAL